MKKIKSERDLLSRAMSAYFRFSTGDIPPPQPANDSAIEKFQKRTFVVLRNCNGILAVYRERNDGLLKRLKRWPKEIE